MPTKNQAPNQDRQRDRNNQKKIMERQKWQKQEKGENTSKNPCPRMRGRVISPGNII
jgi:hypothetical protein